MKIKHSEMIVMFLSKNKQRWKKQRITKIIMIIKDKQKIINKRKLNKNSPSKYDHLGHFFIISSFTNWNIKETVNVLSIFLMTVKNLCYFSPDIFYKFLLWPG